VLMAIPLTIAGMKLNGETGAGVITVFSNAAQVPVGAISSGNVLENATAAGTVANVAGPGQDNGDNAKTAQMTGTSQRLMTFAQLLGIPIGAAVVALIYPLFKSVWGFGSEGLAAPTAHKWESLAILLSKGSEALPPGAGLAMIIAGVAGITLAVLDTYRPKWHWLPSSLGIGLAMLLSANEIIPMALGAIAAWAFNRYKKSKSETYLYPVAAGFMVGETLVILILSALKISGIIE